MASISKDKNGNRRILFVTVDGNRRAIYLGKVNQRTAEAWKTRVEYLVQAQVGKHALDKETAEWVAGLESSAHVKLVAVGLVPPREENGGITLGELLDNYFARRTDVKPGTLTHWRQARRGLLDFFGADRNIRKINKAEARDWERWLLTGKARLNGYAGTKKSQGLAIATVRKRIGDAKLFFNDAVDRELLDRNPFAALKSAMLSNRSRDYFVSQDNAQKVLQACPDAEWRLLFALSRFGGLRCPSEHLALTWDCVDWERKRLLVKSPKTEHHEGHAERWVPLFRELRPHLEAAFDAASSGATHVITRYRDVNANLRTQLCRIIRRAGLSPWPKLFQNLRASRATELAAEHPAHVAAAWLGHSQLVAHKHYWQVTDEDFERAVQGDAETDARRAPEAAQQAAAEYRGDSQQSPEAAVGTTPYATRRDLPRDSARMYSGDDRTRTCTPCGTRS